MSSSLLCRRYKALLFGVTNKYCCSILLLNIPALHSSVVDFESCQFGRFTGKNLTTTASRHGCSTRHRLCFVPSQHLKCLRSRRKRTRDPHLRKELNLQIRTFQKINASMEIGTAVPFFLAFPSRWKDIQHFLPKSVGRIGIVRPHEKDFACMLATLFKGLCLCEVPIPPVLFSGPPWTINELTTAIR